MARREQRVWADWLLAAAIVAAPLAAGGFRLWVLYGLGVLVALAYVITIRGARSLHLHLLGVGLFVLAAFTALQAIPLPDGLLGLLSPRAREVRAFIGTGAGPISYEVGATWREVAKLILYGMIAVVAYQRARSTKDIRVVTQPLVIAAITTSAIAIVHRALGIERLFGLIEARGGSTAQMLTTFVNPNHAAGFMGLAALAAVGLALDEKIRPRRVGLFALAGLFGVVSVLVLSKGGIVALLFGVALLGLLLVLKQKSVSRADVGAVTPAIVAAALLLPIVGLLFRWEAVAADFGFGDSKVTLGLEEKAAAVRDSVPMIADHLWFGIGRGAYVSVYTAYKTSALQLTFAFPENLAAQLASEWGVVVGIAALLALIAALVMRLRSAKSWTAIGALCGVAVIVVQNAVDFSLEMPGVAIPVVAILAATGTRVSGAKRASLSGARRIVFALVPVVLLGATLGLARLNGDLFDDLASLSTDAPLDDATVLSRHPVNALVAARLAYAAETGDPPRLDDAMRLANRTMYFAPTYADGHLLAGRLLIRGGYRNQGFGELRRAWSLAPSARGPQIDHVIDLANSSAELIRAIPRRDEVLDKIDELEATRVVSRLMKRGKKQWAVDVLDALGPTADIAPDALTAVALAATQTGSTALARSALDRRLDAGEDAAARLALARLLTVDGDHAGALEVLDAIKLTDDNVLSVLQARVRIALATKDFDAARTAVAELERRTPPTIRATARLAELLAVVEREAGEPTKAIAALDRGLEKDTGNGRLRLMRAQLLFGRGRHAEARVDAEFVLRRDPDNRVAKQLISRIRGLKNP